MRKILIGLLALGILFSSAVALQFQQKVGPWTLEFTSSKNFSVEIAHTDPSEKTKGDSWWVIALGDKSGNSSATLTFFSYANPRTIDPYMTFLLNAYANTSQAESIKNNSIIINGTKGILEEGFSKKNRGIWRGVAWPYQPYFDSEKEANATDDIIIWESVNLNPDQFQEMAESLHLEKGYRFMSEPWIVEFNSSQKLKAKTDIVGQSNLINLFDRSDHLVAWIELTSSDTVLQATKMALDEYLDNAAGSFKVTSPTKKTVIIDGTEGRMAEGYSSQFSRKWRMIVFPFEAKYDPFTSTNTTKHIVALYSLQDQDQFKVIAESIHITNLAE
jgi:hypothetical protein